MQNSLSLLTMTDLAHDSKPKDWRHFDKKPFVAKLDLLKTLKLWNGILSDRVME